MKTVLITGASGGIGKELAYIFAREGHDVVLVARSETALNLIAKDCEKQHGVQTFVIVADLAVENAGKNLYDEVLRRGIEVDVLVNNAGFGSHGSFVNQKVMSNTQMIQLNIITLMELTALFVKEMVKNKRGKILNIASTAAFQPVPNFAVYAGTKAFVLHFTEALHAELSGTNISISALCPGPTATGFEERAKMKDSKLFKSGVMNAKRVAEVGYQGLMRNKMTIVPGFKNKILAVASGMTPSRKLLVWVAGKMS